MTNAALILPCGGRFASVFASYSDIVFPSFRGLVAPGDFLPAGTFPLQSRLACNARVEKQQQEIMEFFWSFSEVFVKFC